MGNYFFLSVIWMITAMGIVLTVRFFKRKKYRYAIFDGILSLIIPIETVLFFLERDFLKQNEFAYFIDRLIERDLFAYLILLLNLFLFLFNLYHLFFSKKNRSEI